MFTIKPVLRQSILDEGAIDGAGAPPEAPVLEEVKNDEGPQLNVEQFLTNFEAADKDSATKYANKFADTDGNLNVSNMIKSGYSLESKFGSFTGAPEAYEMTAPEGYDGDVNTEDPYLQEFMDKAKSLNMSQDGFNELMDIHLRASIAPPVDVNEMAKEIGPEFNAMRSNMAGFFQSRLDDDGFKALNGMINSVDSFKALYSVYKASKPTKIDEAVHDSFNQAELSSQMDAEYKATDEHGNPKMRDPMYAKSWRTRWEPFINRSDI